MGRRKHAPWDVSDLAKALAALELTMHAMPPVRTWLDVEERWRHTNSNLRARYRRRARRILDLRDDRAVRLMLAAESSR